jgi:hypothetical protein
MERVLPGPLVTVPTFNNHRHRCFKPAGEGERLANDDLQNDLQRSNTYIELRRKLAEARKLG